MIILKIIWYTLTFPIAVIWTLLDMVQQAFDSLINLLTGNNKEQILEQEVAPVEMTEAEKKLRAQKERNERRRKERAKKKKQAKAEERRLAREKELKEEQDLRARMTPKLRKKYDDAMLRSERGSGRDAIVAAATAAGIASAFTGAAVADVEIPDAAEVKDDVVSNDSSSFSSDDGAINDDDIFAMDSSFEDSTQGSCINVATGLPMVGDSCAGLDLGGNAFGESFDDSFSSLDDSMSSIDDSFDDGMSSFDDSFSSFDDSM